MRYGPVPGHGHPLVDDYRTLCDRFLTIASAAVSAPPTTANPRPGWIDQLNGLAVAPESRRTLGDYVTADHPDETAALRKLYAAHILAVEQQSLQSPARRTYDTITDRHCAAEAALAGVSPRESRLAFVGSGPAPASTIAYARHAAAVVGIDREQSAVDAARRAGPPPIPRSS